MADIFDKVITLGIGLEKKAMETLDELEELGKTEVKKEEEREAKEGTGSEEPLGAKKEFENRLVDGGVKAIGEFVSLLKECREKVEGEIRGSSDRVVEKLHMATKDEVDVAIEMARIAREKVDELEKRVAALEGKKKKP
ncbi:MAG: accessory factor UbiK family protein [Thermodesulfobacteriota bacterium]